MDTHGSIYGSHFNMSRPGTNLLLLDDNSGGNQQFKISMYFNASHNYILVVTTYAELQFGLFSIIIYGPGDVGFSRLVLPGMS